MRLARRLLYCFVLVVLAGLLTSGAGQQPSAQSEPAAPPADWVTVTTDTKTCKRSHPPAWVQPDSDGIWGRTEEGEMAMFVEDEETQQAGNWGPVHRMIDNNEAKGVKVEILEESPERIIFQASRGSALVMMSYRRSPETLCAVQIAVPAEDPAQRKIARQAADSLTTVP